MIAWVVIDRTHSRQTPPSFFPRCHSYFDSHILLIPEKIPPFFSYDYELQTSQRLCFDIHTKCPGVYPPRPCCFSTFQRSNRSVIAVARRRSRPGQDVSRCSELSPFLSSSCALFCTRQKLNSFVFKCFRTLCQKPPGVGVGSRVSTRLNWLSPTPSAKIASLPTPCRQAAGQTRNHDE